MEGRAFASLDENYVRVMETMDVDRSQAWHLVTGDKCVRCSKYWSCIECRQC